MHEIRYFHAGPELRGLAGRTVWFRPDTQDMLAYQEVVVDNEYRLPDRFEPRDLVVDVGAHVGTFALACLARGAERMKCYEPAVDNFHLLMRNTFADRGVDIRHAAVWAAGAYARSRLTLHRQEGPSTAMHTVSKLPGGGPAVTAVSIDDALTEPVRLLKLDCEGAEFPILMTARWLDRCREIVGEIHYYWETAEWHWAAVETRLRAAGFDTIELTPHPRDPKLLAHFRAARLLGG